MNALGSGVPRQCDDSTSQQQAAISPPWLLSSFGLTDLSHRASSLAAKPPSEPDWVHEIKHDGHRLIVRRDCAAVACSRGAVTTGPIAIRQSLAARRRSGLGP